MRCQEIMSKNPATVQMNANVQEVARLMADKDIGFVPIVDQRQERFRTRPKAQ